MMNSNKLTTIFLLIISACIIFALGYLIYHGISWSDELMIIAWYDALFLPVYLVAKLLPPTIKRPSFNIIGVVGLVILVWFTSQTYYSWSFDFFSLAMFYMVYAGTGSFIYYYWKLSRVDG